MGPEHAVWKSGLPCKVISIGAHATRNPNQPIFPPRCVIATTIIEPVVSAVLLNDPPVHV